MIWVVAVVVVFFSNFINLFTVRLRQSHLSHLTVHIIIQANSMGLIPKTGEQHLIENNNINHNNKTTKQKNSNNLNKTIDYNKKTIPYTITKKNLYNFEIEKMKFMFVVSSSSPDALLFVCVSCNSYIEFHNHHIHGHFILAFTCSMFSALWFLLRSFISSLCVLP